MPDLPPHVLVLGAGMAGLGAARVLHDAGARVTVIEARDRIGGRTHTSHLWPDLPVDMGASWIHGTKGNPVTALAQDVGLKLTPTITNVRSPMMQRDAKSRSSSPPSGRWPWSKRPANESTMRRATCRCSRPSKRSKEWQRLSPEDRRVARLAINTRIEHEYSGDWTRLSAWHFDDGKDFPGRRGRGHPRLRPDHRTSRPRALTCGLARPSPPSRPVPAGSKSPPRAAPIGPTTPSSPCRLACCNRAASALPNPWTATPAGDR